MNKLITARQRLSAALEKKEKLISEQLESDAAQTPEQRAGDKEKSDACEAEIEKYSSIITSLEKLQEQRVNSDVATDEQRAAGSSGQPSVRITRGENENERGEYVPYRSLGEQLQAIVVAESRSGGSPDAKLVEINKRAASGANEAIGSEGGFLVQTNFASEMLSRTFDTGVIASKCRRIQLSQANSISFNVVEDYSRADGSRWGGVQVYWENEADSTTATKPKFSTLDLKLKKLMGVFYATQEILDDAVALGSWVNQAFPSEFAFKLDNAIYRGTGAGQPGGVLPSNCLVTVSAVSGQGAATIIGQNVLDMRARLWARSRSKAEWFVNQDCEPQIQTLSITKSKSDVPLYSPANGMNQLLDSILARPVNVIEQAETCGTVGDIMLADFSEYLLVERQGIAAAQSIHVKFLTDEQTFRWTMRVDGQPMWKKPLTPFKGTATISPFVVLNSTRT